MMVARACAASASRVFLMSVKRALTCDSMTGGNLFFFTSVSSKLAVLRAGQAFGEMLGGDTLAVRLLRNLSKSLWATSVRLASKQAQQVQTEAPHEALADFNRLLRSRLLPRITPRVTGYDLAASTLAPRQGPGASAWDWFLLPDGRPVFAVMRSVRSDIFSAQRLVALRTLLRGLTTEPHATLGSLLTQASRGVRSGWVEGLSGSVACGMVALADGAMEWVGAGDPCGVLVRAGGAIEELPSEPVAAAEKAEHVYESVVLPLGARDKVILLSGRPTDSVGLVTSVITGGYTSSSRDALNKLFARVDPERGEAGPSSDLSGAVITRMTR
ncbi:MAG: hypothetical protein EXR91_03150 [Gemmatimonadetes bacterium]|nr:hypothetical protein [Gemmatimonadota bacterium]